MRQLKIPKALVTKYPGRRVAIVAGRIVAVSSNAKTSYEAARKKYPREEILIYHVPKKEERYHLYTLCVFHIKAENHR